MDATSTVPRAAVEIAIRNLDYGGLLKALEVSNMVEGSTDVTLTVEGYGRSLRDLAGTANGQLDIVAGPAKVATRFLELWVSNLMTAMLAQAWHRERFTQYHCAAAHIDIHKGEMKTDSLLIDASDHSIAAAGTLSWAEDLDVVMTPRPKDLAVLSLATSIRLTGPLAAPTISTNVESIAASKAWQVLDIADPIGMVLRVPRVILNGPAAENPCLIAFGRGGKETLSTKKAVRTGFDWLEKFWRGTGSAPPILSRAAKPSRSFSTMFKETSRRLWKRLLQEFQDLAFSLFHQLRCCHGHQVTIAIGFEP